MAAAFTGNENIQSYDTSHQRRPFNIPDPNGELWRECAAWLTKWEVIRQDHKSNWPSASIADLANILRDGVLLCKLLNKIDPGSIDMKDVNLKPTLAQFLCLRNINLFLKACLENFGMKLTDLFEDTMLFDLTNFHKVLCTLSKLSLSSKALQKGIMGFSAQNVKTREEEVIYKSLKTVDMTTGSTGHNPSWLQFKIPCSQLQDWEEDIYDDLCYVTFSTNLPEVGIYHTELAVRARDSIDHECAFGKTSEEVYQDLCLDGTSLEVPPTFEKRDFIIKELLDTEKNYVDVLSKLKKNYMQPLKTHMKVEKHNIVFFKIKELKDIHSEFLHELLSIRNNSLMRLSSVFLKWREKFLVYGLYCANLTKATMILQELCDTDEIFNQTVNKYEKEDNNGRFKLRDVLSVPMQRILKYHLLLDKLIENTDPNNDDYHELRKARDAMLDVAGYINEAARDSEHLEVINNLQETITDWNFSPNQKLSDYGRLLKDANLKIKAHDDQRTKNRYVFIFDKCILICKQLKGNLFGFRDLINIGEYHVEEIHNRPILNKEARTSYMFYLVKNDSHNVFTILVRTIELKQQIIKAIHDALDNIHPKTLQRTTHHFELHTFTQPVQCPYCSKYLKGLIYQGYRCGTCEINVHKECIQNSGKCGTLLPMNNSPVNGSICDSELKDKLWFVGEMDRNTAAAKLERRENGTFLVRIRQQSDGNDKYALTLKTDNTVKHMKICCINELQGDIKKYYLSQSKYFSSVEELVLNYQVYSLKENFDRLDQKLLWPFRQLKATAIKKFDAKESDQITVKEDQKLIVIYKEGYREGWWKVRTESNEVGFVPSNILRLEGPVRFDT